MRTNDLKGLAPQSVGFNPTTQALTGVSITEKITSFCPLEMIKSKNGGKQFLLGVNGKNLCAAIPSSTANSGVYVVNHTLSKNDFISTCLKLCSR
jgi:hypothetical protein